MRKLARKRFSFKKQSAHVGFLGNCIRSKVFGSLEPQRHATEAGGEYRYGFNGMEMDDEVKGIKGAQYDYGFRIYDPRIGRFLSVDPLTSSYPMLTPYQFASNTPIQAIDLDGLEAFYVHGTWSDPNTFPKLTISTVNSIFGNTSSFLFDWSGNNTDEARQKAARDLAKHVAKNNDPQQPISLIGHGHGGNVAVLAANILRDEYNVEVHVDNLLTINTPVREYQLEKGGNTIHYNIFHQGDPVQLGGGNKLFIVTPTFDLISGKLTDGSLPMTGELGPSASRFDNAINIDATRSNQSSNRFINLITNRRHDSHTKVYSFSKELREAVNRVKNFKAGNFEQRKIDYKMPTIENDNTSVTR